MCLHCITSYSYNLVCVSLWGLRSYSITCVNFKVLYNRRENAVIYTFCCLLCQFLSIQCGVRRYELIQMVDIGWHVLQWTKGVQPLYGKGTHRLFWAGSRVVIRWISGVHHQLNYCGWLPRFGDPCLNRNCTLNWALGTLQLSRAPPIVNVVSVTVF